jgi:magnesium-transporting ATPase (P-type)
MAAHENGLKVLSFAYKEISMADLDQLMQSHDTESNEFRNEIETGLTYLCTFGLEDPVRESIEETCMMIKYGKHFDKESEEPVDESVKIKMVTGDHIETAKKVALVCGIITEEEANDHGVVMTGEDFLQAVGPYENVYNEETEQYDIHFDNVDLFN